MNLLIVSANPGKQCPIFLCTFVFFVVKCESVKLVDA
jgi:hypothetical protein